MHPNDEDLPTDWQDYWDYETKLSDSFVNQHLQNAKVEYLDHYNEVVRLTDEFLTTFPLLSKLLLLARVTKITSESNEIFYLLGWSFEYGHFGGLTRQPIEVDIPSFHHHHNLLLKHFGGFIDIFGEIMNTSYLTNGIIWQLACQEIQAAAAESYYLNHTYYDDACQQNNVHPSLNLLEDFVQFTEDSEGDFFMYNRHTSEVWIFSHEGYGDGIIEEEYSDNIELIKVEGASEALFFKVKDCLLVDWVERGANAWFKCFEKLPF